MSPKTKKWLKFSLRWGIAIAGMAYVVWNLSLRDRVMVQATPTSWPAMLPLTQPADEQDAQFTVEWPYDPSGAVVEKTIDRRSLLVRADRDRVKVRDESGEVRTMELLGLEIGPGSDVSKWPIVVAEPRHIVARYLGRESAVRVLPASSVVGEWRVSVPYPMIDVGMVTMVRQSNPLFLWAAVFIFPLTYLITSIRWHDLLRALDIHMGFARAFIINMVGAFYNTFMPGSMGGDVLKAYYAAKQAPQRRTRAVMSVLVDRLIGLLSLIIMGGCIAAIEFFRINDRLDPTAVACLQVAAGSGLIIVGVAVFLTIFYTPALRRATGLAWLLQRLPMQRQVQKAVEVMEIYRRRPVLVLWSIVLSFPVHATVVISAMLAGLALQLPMSLSYYWVVVPVVVLAGAIPISPQGAGVMEFFAILLTKREGMTVSQAFALTMSIRLVQIFWNLIGGLFVLRGGYHAPTAKEEAEVMSDDAPVESSSNS